VACTALGDMKVCHFSASTCKHHVLRYIRVSMIKPLNRAWVVDASCYGCCFVIPFEVSLFVLTVVKWDVHYI